MDLHIGIGQVRLRLANRLGGFGRSAQARVDHFGQLHMADHGCRLPGLLPAQSRQSDVRTSAKSFAIGVVHGLAMAE